MKRLNANDTFEANRLGRERAAGDLRYRIYLPYMRLLTRSTLDPPSSLLSPAAVIPAQMNESPTIANVNLSEKRSIMHFMNSCLAHRSRIHTTIVADNIRRVCFKNSSEEQVCSNVCLSFQFLIQSKYFVNSPRYKLVYNGRRREVIFTDNDNLN